MKFWHLAVGGVIGGFIGAGLIISLGYPTIFLIVAILSLAEILHDTDQYYLKKGPQRYLKALDIA